MPRTKTFDEQQALDRAMETFWKKGYHATSMQDLVDTMGINRASLYDTFGGKKALFTKAFERYRSINTTGMKRFLDQQESVKTGLRQLFTRAIEESQSEKGQQGCFVVNVTTELVPSDPEVETLVTTNKEVVVGVFSEFLQKGVALGEIDKGKDLEALANMIFALYAGIKVVGKIPGQQAALLGALDAALKVLD